MGSKYGAAEVEYMKELGARLRSARVLNGRSRSMLAGEVSSTTKQVWLYESGRSMPPALFVDRVARTLNVSRRWLLSGPESPQRPGTQRKSEAER